MYEISREIRVPATPDDVWSLIGDFGAVANWNPAFTASAVETVNGKVQRTIVTGDGRRVIDRLEAHDDAARSYSFTSIMEGPIPVREYRRTLSVTPDGEGSAIRLLVRYQYKDAPDKHTDQLIAAIIESSLSSLQKQFG